MTLAEAQDGSREELGYRRDSEADPQRAGSTFDGGLRVAHGMLGILQESRGMRKKSRARIRQGHLPAGAHEQGSLQLLFEPANLLAEGGLGEKHVLRCLAKVELAGEDDERAQF